MLEKERNYTVNSSLVSCNCQKYILRLKLVIRNPCLENNALKSETEQVKSEIENFSIDVKENSLHHDFLDIILNSDESKRWKFTFHEIFWRRTTEVYSSNAAICYYPVIIGYSWTLTASSSSFYLDRRISGKLPKDEHQNFKINTQPLASRINKRKSKLAIIAYSDLLYSIFFQYIFRRPCYMHLLTLGYLLQYAKSLCNCMVISCCMKAVCFNLGLPWRNISTKLIFCKIWNIYINWF